MKVSIDDEGLFLPQNVRLSVIQSIETSLRAITTNSHGFVVNDSPCYRIQRSGKKTLCVMNSATYISKRFQYNLDQLSGCEGETVILGQAIDGRIRIDCKTTGYRVKKKDDLLHILHRYIEIRGLESTAVYTLFPMFYGMYVDRGFYDIEALPEELKSHFESKTIEHTFTVGVEFETGNIASSFRAINKLYVLFQAGEIDAGVFVTCVDKKSCATRIWPVSNRNGSIQELKSKRYQNQVSLPLITMGFAPDGFDPYAPFLGADGNLYHLRKTGKYTDDEMHEIFTGSQGEEVLVLR